MKELGLSQKLLSSVGDIMKSSAQRRAEETQEQSGKLTSHYSKLGAAKPLSVEETKVAADQARAPQKRVYDTIAQMYTKQIAEAKVVEPKAEEPASKDLNKASVTDPYSKPTLKTRKAKMQADVSDSVQMDGDVLDEAEGTTPKTPREKDLAAKAEPKNKITHKDVMVARGVTKEERVFDEIAERVKTTHENPLVTVHDKDGLHTHANLSVANHIFGTKVKHTDVHAGEVKTKSGHDDGRDLKFAISKHHEKAMKEEVDMSVESQDIYEAIPTISDIKRKNQDKVNANAAAWNAMSDEKKKESLSKAAELRKSRISSLLDRNKQKRAEGTSQVKINAPIAKSEMKEDVEQVDELKQSTLGSYMKKAFDQRLGHSAYLQVTKYKGDQDPERKKSQAALAKRNKGLEGADKRTNPSSTYKIEDVEQQAGEQIAELSNTTLNSYADKAKKSADAMHAKGLPAKGNKRDLNVHKAQSTVMMRDAGLKEEEQIDELNRDTLVSYANKAKEHAKKLSDAFYAGDRSKERARKIANRDRGQLKANYKVRKKDDAAYSAAYNKANAGPKKPPESAEAKWKRENPNKPYWGESVLSADELARIEQIAKDFDTKAE